MSSESSLCQGDWPVSLERYRQVTTATREKKSAQESGGWEIWEVAVKQAPNQTFWDRCLSKGIGQCHRRVATELARVHLSFLLKTHPKDQSPELLRGVRSHVEAEKWMVKCLWVNSLVGILTFPGKPKNPPRAFFFLWLAHEHVDHFS